MTALYIVLGVILGLVVGGLTVAYLVGNAFMEVIARR
jgi:hypothetical protein